MRTLEQNRAGRRRRRRDSAARYVWEHRALDGGGPADDRLGDFDSTVDIDCFDRLWFMCLDV